METYPLLKTGYSLKGGGYKGKTGVATDPKGWLQVVTKRGYVANKSGYKESFVTRVRQAHLTTVTNIYSGIAA